jgi:hypothetical protein
MNTIKTLWFYAAITLLAVAARGQSGPVAWYFLDGDAADKVGTNNGTLVNVISTTNRLGVAASAFKFNGTSSRIDFATPPITQVTNWTIAAWVRPDSLSQDGIAVHVGFDNGAAGNGFGIGFVGNANWGGLFSDLSFFPSSTNVPAANRWYHMAMTRGASTVRFYFNGTPVGTANPDPSRVQPPSDFTIGAQNGPRFFNGGVDDVRIFNRELAPNEILQVYNSPEICFPHAATAEAVLFNGFVVGANITDGGCGYTNPPLVTIQGGGGSNATATATVTNGRVSGITINNPGCCYTNPPLIFIQGPPLEPTLEIQFSRVNVIQHVSVGHNYVLEFTMDFVTWTPAGPPFTAQSETVVSEFILSETGRYFRIREVP